MLFSTIIMKTTTFLIWQLPNPDKKDATPAPECRKVPVEPSVGGPGNGRVAPQEGGHLPCIIYISIVIILHCSISYKRWGGRLRPDITLCVSLRFCIFLFVVCWSDGMYCRNDWPGLSFVEPLLCCSNRVDFGLFFCFTNLPILLPTP